MAAGWNPSDTNFSRAAHQRSEGTMRSIQSSNRNLGIQNAQLSAKTIVRNDSDRSSQSAIFGALYGIASRPWMAMREAFKPWRTTATRAQKTRVTGGACHALRHAGAGQHALCCLAAR
jgi:hypothetical protein